MKKSKSKLIAYPPVDSLFDDTTLSVHIVQWSTIIRKRWMPWDWSLDEINEIWDWATFEKHLQALEEVINTHDIAFKEISRKASEVWQVGQYRIVLVKPPVSPKYELTIVRPLAHLSLEDYEIPDAVKEILLTKDHWILIAWSPWEWKTTFAQAVIEQLATKNLIIKTIEAPRDVVAEWRITQYWLSHTSHNEIRDILLLTRPDISLFDEVRNREDFQLFKDLRLAWIGLIWVMHATEAIDALQRTIWIIELWMVAQVIDTVLFIKAWQIEEILTLKQVVKVPAWMASEDLSRPVIQVSSLLQQKELYEIYTYSDNVIVMPLDEINWSWFDAASTWMMKYAKAGIEKHLRMIYNVPFSVHLAWPNAITLYCNKKDIGRIIWKQWSTIDWVQEELWVSIRVKTFDEMQWVQSIEHDVQFLSQGRKEIAEVNFWEKRSNQQFSIVVGSRTYPLRTNEYWVATVRRKRLLEALREWSYTIQ